MTGTTAQPSHDPPHERKGTDTRHTENISGEKTTKPRGRRGIGGGGNGWKNPARRKTERANESHDRRSQLLGMHMPKTADLRFKALLVVSSFKLHLNALNGLLTTQL